MKWDILYRVCNKCHEKDLRKKKGQYVNHTDKWRKIHDYEEDNGDKSFSVFFF